MAAPAHRPPSEWTRPHPAVAAVFRHRAQHAPGAGGHLRLIMHRAPPSPLPPAPVVCRKRDRSVFAAFH